VLADASIVALKVTSQDATLIAASIAAVATMISLGLNAYQASQRERREARRVAERERRDVHRSALAPELPELADALHQVVATSFMQHKALQQNGQGAVQWRERGAKAAKKLEEVRPRVRYSLGLDEGIRNLTRLPSWVGHKKGSLDGRVMLSAAEALAQALHSAIEESWRSGEPPPEDKHQHVQRLVVDLREEAPIGKKSVTEDAENALDDLGKDPFGA